MIVDNVVHDGIKPKLVIIEAYVEAFVDVKISTQAKLTAVSKLRANEVNTASFFSTKIEDESEMIF